MADWALANSFSLRARSSGPVADRCSACLMRYCEMSVWISPMVCEAGCQRLRISSERLLTSPILTRAKPLIPAITASRTAKAESNFADMPKRGKASSRDELSCREDRREWLFIDEAAAGGGYLVRGRGRLTVGLQARAPRTLWRGLRALGRPRPHSHWRGASRCEFPSFHPARCAVADPWRQARP